MLHIPLFWVYCVCIVRWRWKYLQGNKKLKKQERNTVVDNWPILSPYRSLLCQKSYYGIVSIKGYFFLRTNPCFNRWKVVIHQQIYCSSNNNKILTNVVMGSLISFGSTHICHATTTSLLSTWLNNNFLWIDSHLPCHHYSTPQYQWEAFGWLTLATPPLLHCSVPDWSKNFIDFTNS